MVQTNNPNHGSELSVRQHTRDRLSERTDESEAIDFEEAWENGIKVENPVTWASEVRLYEPAKLLLAITWKESDTVLNVDYSKLNTDGLVKCSECGLLTDPWLDTLQCHWCGEDLEGTRTDGRVQIRLGGA